MLKFQIDSRLILVDQNKVSLFKGHNECLRIVFPRNIGTPLSIKQLVSIPGCKEDKPEEQLLVVSYVYGIRILSLVNTQLILKYSTTLTISTLHWLDAKVDGKPIYGFYIKYRTVPSQIIWRPDNNNVILCDVASLPTRIDISDTNVQYAYHLRQGLKNYVGMWPNVYSLVEFPELEPKLLAFHPRKLLFVYADTNQGGIHIGSFDEPEMKSVLGIEPLKIEWTVHSFILCEHKNLWCPGGKNLYLYNSTLNLLRNLTVIIVPEGYTFYKVNWSDFVISTGKIARRGSLGIYRGYELDPSRCRIMIVTDRYFSLFDLQKMVFVTTLKNTGVNYEFSWGSTEMKIRFTEARVSALFDGKKWRLLSREV